MGLSGISIFLLFVFWSLVKLKRKNRILERQKTEIREKNSELNIQNQEILNQKEEITSQKEKIETHMALVISQREELSKQAENLEYINEQLELANQTKDKFFSIIAHDLKSPFSAILGFSQLLLDTHKQNDEKNRQELIEFLYKSSVSTFNLMENLFTWARSQSGKILFNPETFDLKEMVDETLSGIEGSATIKKIKISNLIRNGLIVSADKNMIKTVFRNLISNAVKFTNKGGEVIIDQLNEGTGGFVSVSVQDNGIGMTEEQIKDLFLIDKTVSTLGTEDEKGSGLGLILCKEFIEKHGGKIRVESKEAKGSSFILTIPLP
jgi:signal transduction histidine kinase